MIVVHMRMMIIGEWRRADRAMPVLRLQKHLKRRLRNPILRFNALRSYLTLILGAVRGVFCTYFLFVGLVARRGLSTDFLPVRPIVDVATGVRLFFMLSIVGGVVRLYFVGMLLAPLTSPPGNLHSLLWMCRD